MAQYHTNFSEYDTGTITDDDWTVEVDNNATWDVQAGQDYDGGQALVIDEGGTDDSGLSWDGKGGSDTEIVTRYRVDTGFPNLNVALRSASGTVESDVYMGRITSDGDLALYKFTNGNFSNLASSTDSVDTSVWSWMRLRANGTELSMSIWQDGNSEPSSWDVQVTDSDHDSGYTGFVARSDTGVYEVDVVGVGTNGDTAPKTGGSAPNAPSNLSATLQ